MLALVHEVKTMYELSTNLDLICIIYILNMCHSNESHKRSLSIKVVHLLPNTCYLQEKSNNLFKFLKISPFFSFLKIWSNCLFIPILRIHNSSLRKMSPQKEMRTTHKGENETSLVIRVMDTGALSMDAYMQRKCNDYPKCTVYICS